jgi:UDP-2-acetamido-2-deoxy-ribo-hexuluronate aminotransferase
LIKTIPFLSLKMEDPALKSEMHGALEALLNSGQYISGDQVAELEENICEYTKSPYSIGCSSGTSALYMALKCLGIGPGDEVIVPALSWFSTAIVSNEIGASTIFADINDDLNISSDSVSRLITSKTKAIIPVHFMGNLANMSKLQEFDVPIIEDASQAFGTTVDEQSAGTIGDFGCISLNPMKSLSALGDAGIILCKKEEHKEKLSQLKYCGMKNREENAFSSLNFRMDDLQAAFLKIQLSDFNNRKIKRKKIFNHYAQSFRSKIKFLDLQKDACPYGVTLFVENREEFIGYLDANGIPTRVQHQPLMSEQKIFEGSSKETTNAEKLVKKILNIPFHDNLNPEDQNFIIEKVLRFYE